MITQRWTSVILVPCYRFSSWLGLSAICQSHATTRKISCLRSMMEYGNGAGNKIERRAAKLRYIVDRKYAFVTSNQSQNVLFCPKKNLVKTYVNFHFQEVSCTGMEASIASATTAVAQHLCSNSVATSWALVRKAKFSPRYLHVSVCLTIVLKFPNDSEHYNC